VLTGSSFDPSTLTIKATETVTWSNTSGILHNVTFSTAGSPADIPDHTSGSTNRTFPTPGTYAYRCTNHAGMNGTIVVTAQ
jgi:plastocyanin